MSPCDGHLRAGETEARVEICRPSRVSRSGSAPGSVAARGGQCGRLRDAERAPRLEGRAAMFLKRGDGGPAGRVDCRDGVAQDPARRSGGRKSSPRPTGEPSCATAMSDDGLTCIGCAGTWHGPAARAMPLNESSQEGASDLARTRRSASSAHPSTFGRRERQRRSDRAATSAMLRRLLP